MSDGTRAPRGADVLSRELLRKTIHIAFGLPALLLRWLEPWQAALLAATALLFNLWLLHPLTRRRLLRPAEHERGYSWGVVLYPALVLASIIIFRRRLELAAAVWGLLAFGDGMAAVAGVIVGGPRLPWNPRKTWSGLTAFVLWGGLAAACLVRWTQMAVFDSGSPGAAAAAYVGSSFLSTSGGNAVVSPSAFLLIGCLAAALSAALAESVETGVDDNVSVTLVGGFVLFAATLIEPARLVEAAQTLAGEALRGALLSGLLAAGALLVRGVNRSGAFGGWLLGTLLYAFGGWRGCLMLVLLFALGTAATRAGHDRKSSLGLAQESGGRRGARHALANTLAGVVAAVLAVATPYTELFNLAMVAAFATATGDTVSSEIGQAFGRRHVLLTRWRTVEAGTEGAVSLSGTLAGIVGAAVVAAVAAMTGLIARPAAMVVVLAAFVGSTIESLISSTAAGRRVSNEALNLANTVVGAVSAGLFYRLIS